MSSILSGIINLAGNVLGTLGITNGGTGATTKAAGFDALSPMTTAGDLITGGASGTGTRVAAVAAGQLLVSAGTGTAPAWGSSVSAVTTFTSGVKLKVSGAGSTTLSWYEEGTFTPVLTTSGTNFTGVTYSAQTGTFTRIGRVVAFSINLTWTATTGSPTGILRISGMPYAATQRAVFGPEFESIVASGTPIGTFCLIDATTSVIDFFVNISSAGASSIAASANGGSTTRSIFVSGSYQV